MAEASGRSQAGWAFRAGKDYKPMLAIQQAQQQLAKDKKYQAEQEAKAKEQAFKDLENYNKLDKSGLSEQFQKKASDISKILLESNKEKLLNNGGKFTYEDKFSMMDMQQQSQDDINWMKAIDSDLKNLETNILKQKDLYNAQEAAKFIQDSTKEAFNKDGTLNKNFSVSDIREKLKSPEYINASAAAERFADTIEKQKLDDVDGLEKRKVTQKFAKYDPETNTFEKDENGNIKVIISPETVALAKQDDLMKTLMDADVKEQKAAGNESYTYSDALGKILKSQQLADVQQTNQRPRANSGGSGLDPNAYGWNTADNVKYLEEPEDSGRFGTKPVEFMANGLKASQNITLTKGGDSPSDAVKGDIQKFTVGGDKEPQIVMSVRGNTPGSEKFTTVPFNEINYKTLIAKAKSPEEKQIIKKAWEGRNSSVGDVYVSPKKKVEAFTLLKSVFDSQGTDRDDETMTNTLINGLKRVGISIDEEDIKTDIGKTWFTSNEIIYKGNTYGNPDELLNALIKEQKNDFSVDESAYQRQLQSINQSTGQQEEGKSAEESNQGTGESGVNWN